MLIYLIEWLLIVFKECFMLVVNFNLMVLYGSECGGMVKFGLLKFVWMLIGMDLFWGWYFIF